jgi:hypothetical protein
MSLIHQPWHILLVTVGGLVNQHQQQIIDFSMPGSKPCRRSSVESRCCSTI